MLKLLTRLLLLMAAIAVAAFPMQSRAEMITVTHWGSAFYGAPYAVAMEKGFFKKYGVDVTGVLTSQGGGTSVRNTLAGDLPYGEVALAAAVEAINNGLPLRIIGAGRRVSPIFCGWRRRARRYIRLRISLAKRSPSPRRAL